MSYEPALAPVDFTSLKRPADHRPGLFSAFVKSTLDGRASAHVDWIVVGGESGPGARPFDVQWARDTIAQGKAAGAPVFVKQLGRWPYKGVLTALELVSGGKGRARPTDQPLTEEAAQRILDDSGVKQTFPKYLMLKDAKGGSMEEWPADLRIREYPQLS